MRISDSAEINHGSECENRYSLRQQGVNVCRRKWYAGVFLIDIRYRVLSYCRGLHGAYLRFHSSVVTQALLNGAWYILKNILSLLMMSRLLYIFQKPMQKCHASGPRISSLTCPLCWHKQTVPHQSMTLIDGGLLQGLTTASAFRKSILILP